MFRAAIFLMLASLFLSFMCIPSRKIQITGTAQGTTYQVVYYSVDSIVTKSEIDSILSKIDSSMSLYKSYSLINKFNNSQKGCRIDPHFKTVILKSFEIAEATNNAFDITLKPLADAWGFGVKKSATSIPNQSEIDSLKKCIGRKYLYLVDEMLEKKLPCVQVDLNGIAQGYTVDLLSNFLLSRNLTNHIVELGGEIRVVGKRQPENKNMRIGIEAPTENEFDEGLVQRIVELENGAVTTSGNYRKYHESKGKRVSHLFDGRTATPVLNELISVTVVAPDAITADGYDNALMAMGLDQAIKFVEGKPDLSAYFIYVKKDGSIADTSSSRFPKFLNL